MHCPRCGTPNEPGDRFCSSCGATLDRKSKPAEKLSPRERLSRLFGTTRKARWISAATVLAVLVAVASFIALKPSDKGIPRDAYTIAADRLCLASKRGIVAVERSFGGGGPESVGTVARELVPIVAAWRSQLHELRVPADRVELARQLEAALLEAEVQIGGLARVAGTASANRTVAKAKEADAASSEVEEAVASLGLTHCAEGAIGFTAKSP